MEQVPTIEGSVSFQSKHVKGAQYSGRERERERERERDRMSERERERCKEGEMMRRTLNMSLIHSAHKYNFSSASLSFLTSSV